jgi:hypothetical protein
VRARIHIRTGVMSVFRTAPMAMHFFSETQVRKTLEAVRLVKVSLTNACERNFNGCLAYSEQEPEQGYVSKSYVVVKDSD